MGFMIASTRVKVVNIFSLKAVPKLFFSFINAFSALSLRSFRPLLISPDGVRRKPKYLYERTFSICIYAESTPHKFPGFIKNHNFCFVCVHYQFVFPRGVLAFYATYFHFL